MSGILGGMMDKIGSAFLPTIVVGSFQKYAGDGGKNLRTAIIMDVDIFGLWMKNWEAEGLYSPDQARNWASMFPNGKNLLTVPNLCQWMKDENCEHLVEIIYSTAGGEKWLRWTLENFKKGLWC